MIERLHARGLDVVAAANPLRSITGDAAYVRDVITATATPVILVGHSYGGTVITEAAAANPSVLGLVYVAGFAPDHGESALELSNQFPGSTLADTLTAYPVSTGGNEFAIQQDAFHHQFAADVAPTQAALLGTTQRPVTQTALTEGLPTNTPAWKHLPSWFVFGDQDLTIPPALHRFLAQRANARDTREITGASHALSISCPDAVTETILTAINTTAGARVPRG